MTLFEASNQIFKLLNRPAVTLTLTYPDVCCTRLFASARDRVRSQVTFLLLTMTYDDALILGALVGILLVLVWMRFFM